MLWLTIDLKTGVVMDTEQGEVLVQLARVSYRYGEPTAIKIGIDAPKVIGITRRKVEPVRE